MADYYNSIITKNYTDSNGNLTQKLIQNENIKVLSNGIALLDEIPYKPYGVFINGYTEVSSGIALTSTQFYVEYNGAGSGKIHFAVSEIGKHLLVTYKAIGKECIIASRIATEYTENGDIVQSLADYIDTYIDVMDANRIHRQVKKYTAISSITTIPYASITGLTWNPAFDNLQIIRDNLILIEDENYTVDDMGITLYEALNTGESIFVIVFRGLLADVPAPSSDGSLLLNGSVGLTKLEQLTQDKINAVPVIQSQMTEKVNKVDMGVFIESFSVLNGEVDDTGRINRALATLTNGGTLYFSPGKTYTTSTLNVSQNNVTLFLEHCTLVSDAITITGENSGIIGNKGIIQGTLKVARLTSDVALGATVLTFENGHPFQVGNGIQCSYGLGGDGSNPITITEITSTTVTVGTATFNSIPTGAYVGTYAWTGTVSLNGVNSFIKGLTPEGISITNARGYALVSKGSDITTYTENLSIYNNGLDLVQVVGSAILKMKNCKLGFIYDIAKQGIVLGDGSAEEQSVKIFLDSCIFNRRNSDPEFFMNGVQNGSKIQAKNCEFIGTNGDHPAGTGGWDRNSWTVVDSCMGEGSMFDKIEILNCTFKDYEQGIISEPSNNTISQNYNELEIKNCKGYNTVLGRYSKTMWYRFDIENCIFDGGSVKTSASSWIINSSEGNPINFTNVKIVNDNTTKNFINCVIKDCTFDHANIFLNEKTSAERITAIESIINTYLSSDNGGITRLKDLTIQHSQMASATNGEITSIVHVNPAGSGIIDFKFLNGTFKGYIYNNNYKNYYILDIKIPSDTFYGDKALSALCGDDWNIPINSKIENILDITSTRIKYVTKSNKTILSTTATATTTVVTLTSVTGVVVNDYINIKLDNGRVWSTKVTEISGNNITLQNALPSQASSGNNVCDFLY